MFQAATLNRALVLAPLLVALALANPSFALRQNDANAPGQTDKHKDKDKDKDKKDKDKSGVPGKSGHDHEPAPTEIAWLMTMHGEDGKPQTIQAITGEGQLKGSVLGPIPNGPAGPVPHDLRGMAILPDQSILAINAFMKDSRILHFGPPEANGVRPYMGDFVKQGPANPAMLHSYAVAISPEGDIYVSNQDTNTVTRYAGPGRDNAGTPMPPPTSLAGFKNLAPGVFIANSQTSPVGLAAVRGICFGPDGYLYVADRDGSRVSCYDRKTGDRVKIVAGESNGLKKPIQLTFTQDGKSLFIGDDGTGEVFRLDMDTGVCSVFVKAGESGLKAPSGLVVSAKWLYVGSRLTKQLLRFKIEDGKPDTKPFVENLPDHPEFILHVIPPVDPAKKP
ncbi:MAG: hypothetical protein K8R92_01105 [Planctomycetes bacterium]|nr:hypothetical protein [Planctomycetota bacterium]